jgi:hypothetical protein
MGFDRPGRPRPQPWEKPGEAAPQPAYGPRKRVRARPPIRMSPSARERSARVYLGAPVVVLNAAVAARYLSIYLSAHGRALGGTTERWNADRFR